MSIKLDRFEGDTEGAAEAALLRATTGPKADRLEEIKSPSNAAALAAYEEALLAEQNAAVGRNLSAPDTSQ
jgi:hypothetical protein